MLKKNILLRVFWAAFLGLATVAVYISLTSEVEVLEEGRVVAKSKYVDKIVNAPKRRVRQYGREFWQVKVPGGAWYECRNEDCPETLRVEFIDHAFTHPEAPDAGALSPYQKTD